MNNGNYQFCSECNEKLEAYYNTFLGAKRRKTDSEEDDDSMADYMSDGPDPPDDYSNNYPAGFFQPSASDGKRSVDP